MAPNSRTGSRRIALTMIALACCLLAGCYEQVTQGDRSTYQFAWWIGLLLIVVGLAGIPIGWFIRKWSFRFGIILMVMGPILLLLVAPSMYNDRVVIDDDHFETRYGFWFSPTVRSLRWSDLSEVRYVGVPGRRGRTSYELHWLSKSGQTTVVSVGTLVENAVPELLTRAKAKGLRVSSNT